MVLVVPITKCQLTRHPRLSSSTVNADSEFDKKGGPLEPVLPNQCSTPRSTSKEAILRDHSEGTRYRHVRVDFHPYTQLT